MLLDLSRFRVYWKRVSASDRRSEEPTGADQKDAMPSGQTGGFFSNASSAMVTNPTMVDYHPNMSIHNIYQVVTNGNAGLSLLRPYICKDADVNASARYPPPRCHPGTRQNIGKKLRDEWLGDPTHSSKIMWLSGPAGTGKSAVAQTFAEYCEENGCLGSSYFFSRPNHRDKFETVIPTIIYHLASTFPEYAILLDRVIAYDPTILDKAPRTQLRKLIVEPFSLLQAQGHPLTQRSLVILLDGLDECHGLELQCELVEMIGELVRLKKDLPFRWLICSRPEPHLEYIFSRPDFVIDCQKHRLLIDADTKTDVSKFLHDGFEAIKTRFWGSSSLDWPSPEQLIRIIEIVDGLFALGDTVLKYIGSAQYADPAQRLVDFLAYMEHADRVRADNPLETLDLLYSRILGDIPEGVWPTTKQILQLEFGFSHPTKRSAQATANFLRTNQTTFYAALRTLHSVLEIPTPADAASTNLRAFHASFSDYLTDSARSGKYHISRSEANRDNGELGLFWYSVMLSDAATVSDDLLQIEDYSSLILVPYLKWSSGQPDQAAQGLYDFWKKWYWWGVSQSAQLCKVPSKLLSFLEDFPFPYMDLEDGGFLRFVSWLSQQGLPGHLLRTEASNDLDKVLLKSVVSHFSARGVSVVPMAFPIAEIEASTT
ncbi:hypothetical protein NP233_g2813 [Leucocoprinus birnbaumii]|uniref:Nephrocystin 3-like N-terminal domain-containing protein n=1 Tax=Leucocoprinus birnbaumii TaxID=56174 RepID=A0AAD5YX05_9AGAR|nr:hypothetical protein NP233_g2813 [Leucocoprinus birnbaumii]